MDFAHTNEEKESATFRKKVLTHLSIIDSL